MKVIVPSLVLTKDYSKDNIFSNKKKSTAFFCSGANLLPPFISSKYVDFKYV